MLTFVAAMSAAIFLLSLATLLRVGRVIADANASLDYLAAVHNFQNVRLKDLHDKFDFGRNEQ